MNKAGRNYYKNMYLLKDKEDIIEELLNARELINQIDITTIDEKSFVPNIEYSYIGDLKKEIEFYKRENKTLNEMLVTLLERYEEVKSDKEFLQNELYGRND